MINNNTRWAINKWIGSRRIQHCDDGWKDLPIELLKLIAERLKYLVDFMSFSVTCKSWNSATSELPDKKPWLAFKYPWLLLAEDTGLDLSAVKVSSLNAVQKPFIRSGYFAFGEDQTREIDHIIDTSLADLYKNISSTRGLFSLATQKVYNTDLSEATDKLIFGTNKGWLVTLGKDLEINLLHPLQREQISLPPMLTLPIHEEYDEDSHPQGMRDRFISKVVMSSEVPTKSALQNQDTSHLPMIMTIYKFRLLAVARLGDKLWTNVELSNDRLFEDITYHKKKFYAINFRGQVYMCDIDNEHQKGTMITSIPIEKNHQDPCYLIESLVGFHIWVVVRIRKTADYEPPIPGELEYFTSNFVVLKLEVHYSNSGDATTSCTWTEEVKDLGNEALFFGTASSVSVASLEFIKPNSIYFTDVPSDKSHCKEAGGHDMGIFNLETGQIQPHFPGVSLHPFSPPLWYM